MFSPHEMDVPASKQTAGEQGRQGGDSVTQGRIFNSAGLFPYLQTGVCPISRAAFLRLHALTVCSSFHFWQKLFSFSTGFLVTVPDPISHLVGLDVAADAPPGPPAAPMSEQRLAPQSHLSSAQPDLCFYLSQPQDARISFPHSLKTE